MCFCTKTMAKSSIYETTTKIVAIWFISFPDNFFYCKHFSIFGRKKVKRGIFEPKNYPKIVGLHSGPCLLVKHKTKILFIFWQIFFGCCNPPPSQQKKKKKRGRTKKYQCYFPKLPRDSLSPVCGIFNDTIQTLISRSK